jgi:ABC-type sugar transport system substrate-binding protein
MSTGRRMSSTALVAVALLSIALAAPVSAAKPARGCGAADLKTIEQFRMLSLSVGVPPEILGADWETSLRTGVDKNGDGSICVKDVPDTKGHLGTWIFNVVDNTSNS